MLTKTDRQPFIRNTILASLPLPDLAAIGPFLEPFILKERMILQELKSRVEHVVFEHSPGRREDRFLADGTALDLALRVISSDGDSAMVFIELKYSEDMAGPAARLRRSL